MNRNPRGAAKQEEFYPPSFAEKRLGLIAPNSQKIIKAVFAGDGVAPKLKKSLARREIQVFDIGDYRGESNSH